MYDNQHLISNQVKSGNKFGDTNVSGFLMSDNVLLKKMTTNKFDSKSNLLE